MLMEKSKFLRDIERIRIPDKRDLKNGLRLDRNEKIDLWKLLESHIRKQIDSQN